VHTRWFHLDRLGHEVRRSCIRRSCLLPPIRTVKTPFYLSSWFTHLPIDPIEICSPELVGIQRSDSLGQSFGLTLLAQCGTLWVTNKLLTPPVEEVPDSLNAYIRRAFSIPRDSRPTFTHQYAWLPVSQNRAVE